MLAITQEAPRQPDILCLLDQSDAHSAALYPPDSRHLVDVAFLSGPSVRFFVARRDGRAVGCGALVPTDGRAAELKRMFVVPGLRGHGIGRALMTTIEDAARQDGVRLLLLETGVQSTPALALYRRCGFQERGPFGAYRADKLSVFMSKAIAL